MAKNPYFYIVLFILFAGTCVAQQSDLTRAKVVKSYTAQIGVRELTGNNDGKAVETYLRYVGLPKGNPWCAAFVCWNLNQAGVANPRSGYCPDLFKPKQLVWLRSRKVNGVPHQTDVFGLYFPEKGRIAHVGYIDRWTDIKVYTVEGNTNQAGSREGDGVYRKIRLTRQIYAVTRFIP